jgi:hypothetical protein
MEFAKRGNGIEVFCGFAAIPLLRAKKLFGELSTPSQATGSESGAGWGWVTRLKRS